MERSRLPLPSLLGLCGALLMLSPEVLISGKTYHPPVTDEGVQEALTFTMQQYNKGTGDSTNYFKLLHFVKVVREVDLLDTYHLTVLLVQTKCEKRPGRIMTYKSFQKCPLFPVNPKKLNCYFRAFWRQFRRYGMSLEVTSCTPSVPPKELFCSG